MRVIYYDIPEIVNIRKYDVDIKGLQKLLKNNKTMTIKEISEKLKLPKTQIEHWFRTDKYFTIPEADIWFELKKVLKIKTDRFDKSIMTFEKQLSVHEQSNRVYNINGIAPTILSTGADIRILC